MKMISILEARLGDKIRRTSSSDPEKVLAIGDYAVYTNVSSFRKVSSVKVFRES